MALLACLGILGTVSAAQEERPQIMPGERKVTRKKDAGPRAVGVLQLTANGKASLVPIAILINGRFYDASVYKASPVPMALETGTVYEAERTGSSLGLFTVNSALHSNAVNVQSPWIGTGAWLPTGTQVAKTTRTAEAVPVGIDSSDEPPRLTRSGSAAKETPPASTAPPSTSPSPPSSASSDGPPRLTKSESTPKEAPTAPTAAPTPASTSAHSDSKPGDAKAAARPNEPASDSGADEASRPRLRRGKPVEPLPEDEVPGYSKPGAVPSANAGKIAESAPAKGPMQTIPAISDAGGPDPHSYTFDWLKDEEGERRQQVMALAKAQVLAYVEARAKERIAPKPSGPQAARRHAPHKAREPIFGNVRMIAYDLWTTNQPVLVFSAEAHMPPPPAGSPEAAADADLQYSVLIVARTDIYNNLHKLYVGVTDKYHLDVTPRLELIDAVDADGDGRGELLFRETSDAGNGWVIYRPTADKLWKMFDSLNPE